VKEKGKETENQNNTEEDKTKRKEKRKKTPKKKFFSPACTTLNALPFPALSPPTISIKKHLSKNKC